MDIMETKEKLDWLKFCIGHEKANIELFTTELEEIEASSELLTIKQVKLEKLLDKITKTQHNLNSLHSEFMELEIYLEGQT